MQQQTQAIVLVASHWLYEVSADFYGSQVWSSEFLCKCDEYRSPLQVLHLNSFKSTTSVKLSASNGLYYVSVVTDLCSHIDQELFKVLQEQAVLHYCHT